MMRAAQSFARRALAVTLLWLGVLFIAAADGPPSSDWHYTLRPKDSLQTVGESLLNARYTWSDLARHNQISQVDRLAPGSIIKIPISWLKQQPHPAIALSTAGHVMIKRAGEVRYEKLDTQHEIRVGDEIATQQGSVLIRFADGSILRLEEHSNLIFNRLSKYGNTGMVDTRMRLNKGSIATEVKPMIEGSQFEISTPSAVAAVRGTAFRVHADANQTRVEVTEGVVEVSHEHGATQVEAGQGVTVHRGSQIVDKRRLPDAPEPLFSDSHITELPKNLEWEATPQAESYRYEINHDSGQRVKSQKISAPEMQLRQLKSGTYNISIRAVDGAGYEGIDSESQVVIELARTTAELLSPADDSTVDTTHPEFSWKLSDLSASGRLEIATEPTFKKVVHRSNYLSTTRQRVSKPLQPGRYYWRVQVVNDDGEVDFSPVRSVKIRATLDQVSILSVNYLDNQVGLYWNSLDKVDTYVLQLSDSAGFETILREEELNKTSALIRLSPGKKYYARVKGLANDNVLSEFGPVKELFIEKP